MFCLLFPIENNHHAAWSAPVVVAHLVPPPRWAGCARDDILSAFNRMIVFDCFKVHHQGRHRDSDYDVLTEEEVTARNLDAIEFLRHNRHLHPAGDPAVAYNTFTIEDFVRIRVAARAYVRRPGSVGPGATWDMFPAADRRPHYLPYFGPDESHGRPTVGVGITVTPRVVAVLAGYLLAPANLNQPTAGGLYLQLVQRFGIGEPWQVRFFLVLVEWEKDNFFLAFLSSPACVFLLYFSLCSSCRFFSPSSSSPCCASSCPSSRCCFFYLFLFPPSSRFFFPSSLLPLPPPPPPSPKTTGVCAPPRGAVPREGHQSARSHHGDDEAQ